VQPEEDEVDIEDEWEDISDMDPTNICIQRWRNAGPEQRKRMWKMFDECGLFLSVCRHGSVLYFCDMIRSGEL
jgi:hypothetical protein